MKYFISALLIFCFVSGISAQENKNIYSEWGGHLREQGTLSKYTDKTFFKSDDHEYFIDGSMDFRLKNKIYLKNSFHLETHYEAVLYGGDTKRKINDLVNTGSVLLNDNFSYLQQINDDKRFFNLTKQLDSGKDRAVYHRLDRLKFTYFFKQGTLNIGRQAVTWGNGLIFNPMDLFNPFAPAEVQRDYKTGDDLILLQYQTEEIDNCQILYIPRRSIEDNPVNITQSSIAAKLHFSSDINEFDFMFAQHFNDEVLGFGVTGYFKESVWRFDITETFLIDKSFFSIVANTDYSWVWLNKNYYGLIEYYYNGLGIDKYNDIFNNTELSERLYRGEIYTVGRSYLSGKINIELHPLFNFDLSLINNTSDPSGIIQPKSVWNVKENLEINIGANIKYGGKGTEFGGYEISGTDYINKPADTFFVWLTAYF